MFYPGTLVEQKVEGVFCRESVEELEEFNGLMQCVEAQEQFPPTKLCINPRNAHPTTRFDSLIAGIKKFA